MTLPGFIIKNALRNKRRALLTVLSVAVSLFLFTTLQTALRELTQPAVSEAAALRIIVRHRVSLASVLPEKYEARIERMPGVEVCTKFTWFGGVYKDEKNFFPQFACEADKLFRVFTECTIDPKEVEAFIREKNACVVGIKTMERFGLKLGDKITLQGAIWACDPELVIRGVYRDGIDQTNLFFHHDYFDELLGRSGLVGTYWIKADTADTIPGLIERIDRTFRNTDAETKTETERAFQLGFISMFGNIKMLMGSICTVIVFTMLLVTAATMSTAIRERIRELAILKAMGFDGLEVFGLILAEACGLAAAGGLLGCVGAWALFRNIDIYALTQGFFIKFEVTPHILLGGLLLALGLGIVSVIAPALSAIRMPIITGLRELD